MDPEVRANWAYLKTTRRQEQQAKKKQFLPSTFQWSPDIEEKYKKQGLFFTET